MLLNALLSAPEGAEEVLGKSLYVMRSGSSAGTFLYFVGLMAGLIFILAVLASLRVGDERTRR